MAGLQSHFQLLVFIFVATSFSAAVFSSYYSYFPSSQISAVSLNNAPIGIYGRSSGPYGGTEEYSVSIGGAAVGIYGNQNTYKPQSHQPSTYYPFLPLLYNYWPTYYPLEYYPYDDYFNSQEYWGSIPEGMISQSEVPSVQSRRRGTFASAKATADSLREKSTAEASSFQGQLTDDMIKQILNS